MAAMPLRQQVIDYVDQLDDEQTLRVIAFMETLLKSDRPLQNPKTPEERARAKQVLDELLAMARPARTETTPNGRKETAELLWRKYESLD